LGASVNHHPILLSNYFAQTEALAFGKDAEAVAAELEKAGLSSEEKDFLIPHKVL
jgi:glucose-6-phosphate isomerase